MLSDRAIRSWRRCIGRDERANQMRSPRTPCVAHASSDFGGPNTRGFDHVHKTTRRMIQIACQPSQTLLQIAGASSGRIYTRLQPLTGLKWRAYVGSSIPIIRSERRPTSTRYLPVPMVLLIGRCWRFDHKTNAIVAVTAAIMNPYTLDT